VQRKVDETDKQEMMDTTTRTQYDNLYVQDGNVHYSALALIATEPDEKYRKKYASVWKSK
jgi:hypothetical protein